MFNWLRKKRPSEGSEINHFVLGKLTWNKEDNEWIGSYSGVLITLAYEDNLIEPSNELIDYASKMLEGDKLGVFLEREKEKLMQELGELSSEHRAEIIELYFDSINFSLFKGKGYIFICLGPNNDERCWRLEIFGDNESALGFDS